MIFADFDKAVICLPAPGFMRRAIRLKEASFRRCRDLCRFITRCGQCGLLVFLCIRCGRQQQMGLRVIGMIKEFIRRGIFHYLAPVHHRNVMAQIAYHVQVMGYKEVTQTQLILQVF